MKRLKPLLIISLAIYLIGCFKLETKPEYNYDNLGLPQGIIYYLPLNGNLKDVSPKGNDAKIETGAESYSEDKNNKPNAAYKFGSSGGIRLLYPFKNFIASPSGSTVSFELYLDNAGANKVQHIFSPGYSYSFYIIPSQTKTIFRSQSSIKNDFEINKAILGKWVNICLIYKMKEVDLYLDGEKINTFTFGSDFPSMIVSLFGSNTISYNSGSTYATTDELFGSFDNIMGFNRALNDTEIKSINSYLKNRK